MDILDRIMWIVLIAWCLAGPAILLILARRLVRSWIPALAISAPVIPVVSFLVWGGLTCLLTMLRAYVTGGQSTPEEFVGTGRNHAAFTFEVCGAYGVIFTGLASPVWVFLVLIWWFAFGRRSEHVRRLDA